MKPGCEAGAAAPSGIYKPPPRIVTVHLNHLDLRVVKRLAQKAELGGKSHLRQSDRLDFLAEDQLAGQIGQYAGCKWLYGHIHPYIQARWYANQNPQVGDGGHDIPGANIDFKTSKIRTSLDFYDHRLAVRPAERHPGWVYILVLATWTETAATAHLMGWATDEMLPEEPEKNGTFAGAFTLPTTKLNPLPPFRWKWF